MESNLRPMYLFADSQLLFWRDRGNLFLDSLLPLLSSEVPRAAYIGAANGDKLEYYQIFTAAMAGIGIRDCRLIRTEFPPSDQSFIATADIVLLAGGDVELGWRAINATGLAQAIAQRYLQGAVLMGVSAGAVHLGRHGFAARGESVDELIDTFNFFPFVVGVHEERHDWEQLAQFVRLLDGTAVGIGIPSGGGLIYCPDGALQAVRQPLCELSVRAGELRRSLLLPS